MKTALPLWVVIVGISITFISCEKEDELGEDIIVETGNFSDARDGISYKWVKIGDQIWMAENLKFLPSVVDKSVDSPSTPYYYVHSYEGSDVDEAKVTTNYITYGVLYNWPAALTACPEGWHLPSYDDWEVLIARIGRDPGTKLKSTSGWRDNGNGVDSFGFRALPGGARLPGLPENYFSDIGYAGNWWVSNESEAPNAAWYADMDIYGSGVGWGFVAHRGNGMSVRCIKD